MRLFANRPILHWLIRGETGCGIALTVRQFEERTTRDERDVNCRECCERIAREKAAHGSGQRAAQRGMTLP